MDPYYFLDLQLIPLMFHLGNDAVEPELHDLIEETACGNWNLDTKERSIITYKEEYFSRITFDNDKKVFTFYRGKVIAKSFKLTLVEM